MDKHALVPFSPSNDYVLLVDNKPSHDIPLSPIAVLNAVNNGLVLMERWSRFVVSSQSWMMISTSFSLLPWILPSFIFMTPRNMQWHQGRHPSGKDHLALAVFRCFSCPRASWGIPRHPRMSQGALGQLKHLKTASARWPFPDVFSIFFATLITPLLVHCPPLPLNSGAQLPPTPLSPNNRARGPLHHHGHLHLVHGCSF